eukprot:scaffold238428_cov18-Prasinocladus_malaysianus.AAC.1
MQRSSGNLLVVPKRLGLFGMENSCVPLLEISKRLQCQTAAAHMQWAGGTTALSTADNISGRSIIPHTLFNVR